MRSARSRYVRHGRPSLAGIMIGTLVGIGLFFGGFGVLWWNEGRTNLADLAREAKIAEPSRIDPALDGELVSLTGSVAIDDAIGDPEYLLPGAYVTLDRSSEMYAWIEHQSSRNRYNYTLEWTSHPPDSNRFQQPAGHDNPPMRVSANHWSLRQAAIGRYRFSPATASMPHGSELLLAPDMLNPSAPNSARFEAGFIYLGMGSIALPILGDVRLTYRAYRPNERATLFGEQRGENIEAHTMGLERFYRLVAGDHLDAVRTLAIEHRATTWLLRMMGLMFLWLGMNLFAQPLSAILDIIPPLGRASRALVATVTLPVALALWAATIILSMIFHSGVAMVIVLTIFVFVIVRLVRARKPFSA